MPPHAIDLVDVTARRGFEVRRQSFNEPRPAERIDHVRKAGLVQQDLLRPQCERRRLTRRAGRCVIERAHLHHVHAAGDRGQGLERGAHDMIVRLIGVP